MDAPASRYCPKCSSLNIKEEEDGNLVVCVDCGFVLEELHLVSSDGWKPQEELGTRVGREQYGSTQVFSAGGHALTPCVKPRKTSQSVKLEQIFRTVCSRFNLSDSVCQQMVHLAQRVKDERRGLKVKSKDKGSVSGPTRNGTAADKKAKAFLPNRTEPLAGAIIYAVCRQNGKPFTMGQIAEAIDGCQYNAALKAFLLLKRNLKDLTVKEAETAQFIEPTVRMLKLPTQTEQNLIAAAKSIASTVGDNEWVGEGKSKHSLALASILVAAGFQKLKLKVSQLRLPPDLTERTLRDRVKELKESMVRFMDEHGPLPPGTVTMKTLTRYADWILKELEARHKATKQEVKPDIQKEVNERAKDAEEAYKKRMVALKVKTRVGTVDPSSFVHAQEARERRLKKLERAKQRVQFCTKNAPKARAYLQMNGLAISASEPPQDILPVKVKLEEEPAETSTDLPSQLGKRKRDTTAEVKEETSPEEPAKKAMKPKVPDFLTELDEEDRRIELCLLNGVSERDILDGNVDVAFSTTALLPPNESIYSEELNDDDLSKEEFAQYVGNGDTRALRKLKMLVHHDEELPDGSDFSDVTDAEDA